MAYLDQLLRAVVPDGFALELLVSLVFQMLCLSPVVISIWILLRRRSASTRHFAWQLLLLAILVGPTLSFLLPSIGQFSILDPRQRANSSEPDKSTEFAIQQTLVSKSNGQQSQQPLPSVTLPGGQMLQRSDEHRPLVDAAMRLLHSASVEVPYRGQRGTSVTLSFHPSLEIDLSQVSPRNAAGPTGRIGRMYLDVGTQPGPDTVATEIDGKYRSFTKHHLREWVAFRREYDRLDFGRPRPIVPAVGDWSKPVDGLQARLAVENWRDPIVGVYLELRNVKDLGNTMTLPADAQQINFDLRDADGKKISPAGVPRSGPVVELKDFQLPFDSSLRFNLSVTTVGVPNVKAMIALRSHAWTLDELPASYRLRISPEITSRFPLPCLTRSRRRWCFECVPASETRAPSASGQTRNLFQDYS